MIFLIEGVIVGFAGSFHCVGMCGPIALALPVKNSNFWAGLQSIIIYNMGRTVTYAAMGLLFGVLGLGIKISGYQQSLSIVLGIFMIVGAINSMFKIISFKYLPYFIQKALAAIRKKLSEEFKIGSGSKSMFIIGLLNGLLPCGFVYIAIIWTLSLGNIVHGALFMFFFGLGTIPAMLFISMGANILNLNFRRFINRLSPAFIILMGCILIFRGMNLGISFSPQLSSENESLLMPFCH